jgi:putative membrane protein
MNEERDPIELSRRLVYLAAERTLTSWVRTALSLMALGFVIDRFGLIVKLMPDGSSGPGPGPEAYRGMLSSQAGSILIGMGAAMALTAGVRYLRFAIGYHRRQSTRVRHGIVIGACFALLLGLFGIALIVLLTAVLR